MVDFNVKEKGSGETYWAEMLERVEVARKWRRDREHLNDKSWINCRKMAAGKHWNSTILDDPSSDDPNELITINSTQSMLQDYKPFLVRQSPGFRMSPRPQSRADTEDIEVFHQDSRIVGRAVEYFWEEYQFQDAYSYAVDDGLEIGHGVVEVGWATEIDEHADDPKNAIELDAFIRLDAPFARRHDPLLFHFDQTASDRTLRTARWCGVYTFTTKRDLIWNKIYSKKIRDLVRNEEETPEEISAFMQSQFDGQMSVANAEINMFSSMADGPIVLLRLWDKKFNKYLVFAKGIKEPILEREATDLAALDTFFPFTMWKFSGRPGEPFSESVPSLTRDLTLERNRIRTAEFHQRRKHGSTKYFVDQSQINADMMRKLTSANVEIIPVSGPVDMAIKAFNAAPIPNDNYTVDGIIANDMRELIGLSALQTGAALPSRTSAKEVDARERNTSLKLEDRKGRVDDLALGMGKHLVQLMRQHLTQNQLVEIVGADGASQWEQMSPEQIQREYTLKVISSSSTPEDPVAAAALFGDLVTKLTEAGPLLQAQGKAVDYSRLITIWLEKLDVPGTEGIIMNLPPPPQPTEGTVPGAGASATGVDQNPSVAPGSLVQGPVGAAG